MFKSLFGFFALAGFRKKKGSAERLSEKGFVPSGPDGSATPKILLTQLTNDKGGEVGNRLGEVLTGIQGVDIYRHKKAMKVPNGIENPAEKLIVTVEEGRAWLTEERADLLIWGDIDDRQTSLSLRLLPAQGSNGEQLEISGLGQGLEFPVAFADQLNPLICAAAIGVFGPTFKGARKGLGETLGGYLENVGNLVQTLPAGLNEIQAASVLTAVGNAFVAHSSLGGGQEQLEKAVMAYREAEKQVPKETQLLAWARIQNSLAAVLQAQGQNKKDPALLRKAAVIYSTVTANLSATAHANDWAMANIHLGKALYILAGLEGKPEYLKRAGAAYEEALSVYSMEKSPSRWAEVTNQYGVVLLALGEETDGGAALEEAVSKFRTAIKVWQRDKAPLAWAQTANNLGAACFALAKRNSENSLLREASDYFEGATEIYRQQGITKQAKVIEKNLQRVKRLLMSRGG
ncbi:MAG: tetratricopeptide repeat protein [Proteobacteria bacterium]|nr:tetratricopeptide repeat protein [Pseudomonadota bacterium]